MIPSIEPVTVFPSVSALTNGPASAVSLQRRTIDLWSCALKASESGFACCRNWLTEDERTRADRFVRPEDQIHFTLAHGAVRFVLARYVNLNPAALRFENGPTGKPALINQQGSYRLHFNLSHSHGRMLIAVARQEVGVDLEEVRDKVDVLKLAQRFYTPLEYEWVRNRPAPEQAERFYRLWVAKEALLKGQGIGIPSLQQCEIVTPPVWPRVSIRSIPGSAIADGWTIQWLNCGLEWQGAVSMSGDDWSVRVLDSDGS